MKARIVDPTESFEESRAVLEETFGSIMDEDTLGIEPVLAMLELPDLEFNLMQEHILEELEKSLNNPNDKLLMVQSMAAQGLKAEDLVAVFQDVASKLEEQLRGHFTQEKIDFVKRFLGSMVNAIQDTENIPKRTISVPMALCREGAVMPTYANLGDAGMDLYACEEITILPGETKIVPTGIKVAVPMGYELQVRPRSGQSAKTKLRVANSPGTIDSGFRGEVGVILENVDSAIRDITTEEVFKEDGSLSHLRVISIATGAPYVIEKGQRFAQLVLSEVPTCVFYEVDSIDDIGRDRLGGFGSSGK